MDKQNKFFVAIGLCGLTVLLAAFILTWIGAIDLKIVATIQFNQWIEYLSITAMFMINMYFMLSISLLIFNKNILPIVGLYLIIYVISSFVIGQNYPFLLSSILPSLYIIIIAAAKYRKTLSQTILRLGLFLLIVAIYQQISGFIKLYGMQFTYYNCNAIILLMYSLDMYLFFILLYCVVRKYAVGTRKHFVYCKTDRVQPIPESSEESLDTTDLTRRQLFVLWILAAGYQVFQLIIVLLIGLINNVFVELVIMLVMFWIGRAALQKSWHSDKLWVCSVVTFAGFYILTKLTLPISVSLFSCIALSALFVYLLHKAALIEEHYTFLKAYHKNNEAFDLYKCTEEELRARCRERKVKPPDEAFAIDAFINRMSIKELGAKYVYGESTTKTKKQRLIKKLNN